jgi:hypothetical protein
MLNKRILSGFCSSSIPSNRYSKELMNLAKDMINIDASQRPSIKQILNMMPVKKRLEYSDITPNNFNDYAIIRGLQTSIYPPMNLSGWDRVIKKLREILGMEKEDLLKKEDNFNYDLVLKYLPPKKNSYETNLSKDIQLPPINNNQNNNNYYDRYKYLKPRVKIDPISKNQSRLSSPPWAKHFL